MTVATAKRTVRKQPSSFETTVEVCCHRVAVRYWGFDHELTDELIEVLTNEGEERTSKCIIEGCRSGELNCYYLDGKKTRKSVDGGKSKGQCREILRTDCCVRQFNYIVEAQNADEARQAAIQRFDAGAVPDECGNEWEEIKTVGAIEPVKDEQPCE